jgi:DNA-directed RNA polymerase specialized sigma24 family protein
MSAFPEREDVAALYDRHGPAVFNFYRRTGATRETAAVATQAAFLCALRQHRGRDASDFPTRLLVAARQAAARPGPAGRSGSDPALPVEDANRGLAPAHREVLALHGLLGCSYEGIAAAIRADRPAVAELLWRARLELRDRLTGSGLVAIAAVAEPCRRALPLIAMRLDDELADAGERRRLRAHLRTCGKCRVAQAAMREADSAYCAWPQEPLPNLAELVLVAAEISEPAAEPAA